MLFFIWYVVYPIKRYIFVMLSITTTTGTGITEQNTDYVFKQQNQRSKQGLQN